MFHAIDLLWLPVTGAVVTAIVLSLPEWLRDRRERSHTRQALTDRLARVYSLELRAAPVRVPAPAMALAQGSGWDEVPAVLAEELTSAAEAFLAGGYRRHLEDHGRTVPAWAWVNPLAHGSLDHIEDLAARSLWAVGPEAVVARVAGNISRLVRSGQAELVELQEHGLMPLEDRLATDIPEPDNDAEVAHTLAMVLRRWLDLPDR